MVLPWQSYGTAPAIWNHTVLPATRHKWTSIHWLEIPQSQVPHYSFLDGQPISKSDYLSGRNTCSVDCWATFKTTEKSWTLGQISPSCRHRKSECLSASGGFAPLTMPWTPLGAEPPCLRYRLAQSARHLQAEFLDPPLVWASTQK